MAKHSYGNCSNLLVGSNRAMEGGVYLYASSSTEGCDAFLHVSESFGCVHGEKK